MNTIIAFIITFTMFFGTFLSVLCLSRKRKAPRTPPPQPNNPAPAQQAGAAGGATPAAGAAAPATPATTPPPPPTNPLVWVGATIAVILTIFLLPWSWIISIFGNGTFWRIAGAIGLYALVSSLLFKQDVAEKARGNIMAVAFILLVLVIVGQLFGSTALSIPSGVKSFFAPRPEPEIIWRETKVIEVPSTDDWARATEVTLPWAISKWGIYSLTEPPEDGSEYLEIMTESWDEPFQVKRRESFRLPTLPGNRTFKIRSLTGKPLKIEVRWR